VPVSYLMIASRWQRAVKFALPECDKSLSFANSTCWRLRNSVSREDAACRNGGCLRSSRKPVFARDYSREPEVSALVWSYVETKTAAGESY